MCLKGEKTKSDYIEWNKLQSLILKLERDGDWKFSLLLSIGCFTGLRISDILSLKWIDVIDREFIEITEKKTKKYRKIKLNPSLIEIINRIVSSLTIENIEDHIFLNRFKTSTMSIQCFGSNKFGHFLVNC